MPSWAIQTTSVTCCRPCRPASSRRCSRSPARAPPSAPQRSSRSSSPGDAPPACSRAAARRSGEQRAEQPARGGQPEQDRERWHRCRSHRSGLQQEVEADARDAEHQQRRVVAHEAALYRAHGGRAGAHDARSCRRSASRRTNTRSNVPVANAPAAATGRTTSASISSSKYHLCDEQLIHGREALARCAAAVAGLADPDAVGDRDPAQRRARCRAPGRSTAARRACAVRTACELGEASGAGSRRSRSRLSGSARARRRPRRSRAALIATFIGSARSAIAWCGPGKPTSVSSTSPLAGLVGTSAWCRWPPSSSRASAHGLAVEGAEDHPERVDRGQERAEVADHVQRPVPAAALAGHEQDLVLGEEARERRDARQREAADHEARVRERHRLAEAAHLLERLLAAHRADQRARAP